MNPTAVEIPPDVLALCRAAGLAVRAWLYRGAIAGKGAGKGPCELWVFARGGREVGTWVPGTGWCRVENEWRKVDGVDGAVAMAAEVANQRGRGVA